MTKVLTLILSLVAIAAAASCGSGHQTDLSETRPGEIVANIKPVPVSDQTVLPSSIPVDKLQPWEKLNISGCAVSATSSRGTTGIYPDSEFVAGVERHNSGGDAVDNGEATRLTGPTGNLSYALYRVPLGGAEPGVVSVDANLLSGDGYYVGLANYASGAWDWHGPMTDNHVRVLTTAGGDYTSDLGSLFTCVVAWDDTALDIVGLGVGTLDPGDTDPPPAPSAPIATPIPAGLLLEWIPVAEGDLAGYNVYYSSSDFSSPGGPGIRQIGYLEGSTRHLLTGLSAETIVRISAVDTSGNESALSDAVVATPLAGPPATLSLNLSSPSGVVSDTVSLGVTGAVTYDFDTDGDGTYESTGNTTGSIEVTTNRTGVIRPYTKGRDSDGKVVACGAVSLVISSNSRPVANAAADRGRGEIPLFVQFAGDESIDFDGSIVGGGWDLDGDGTYDVWDDADIVHVTSASHLYMDPGAYHAKLRVVDDAGAWDVDTVTIVVDDNPTNMYPVITEFRATPASGPAPLNLDFTFNATDPDGDIDKWEIDYTNSGTFSYSTETRETHGHTYNTPGLYTAVLKAEDNKRARSYAFISVLVTDPTEVPPVANLTADLTSVPIGLSNSQTVRFDFTGSSDPHGGTLTYALDHDGDGVYSSFSATDFRNETYSEPGTYQAKLKVQSDSGQLGYDTVLVEVYKFANTTIESDGTTGLNTFCLNAGGLLGVAYWDADGELRHAISDTPDGTGWSNIYTVDSGPAVGIEPSLATISGGSWLGVSYHDAVNGDLKYCYSTSATGNEWQTPVTVVSTDSVGSYNYCLEVDGRPAIAYYDSTSLDLHFIRALNSTGSSWPGSPVAVDGTGAVGQWVTMAIVDGRPAVAYYDATNQYLKYCRAGSTTGSSWNSPVTVAGPDDGHDVGKLCHLVIADGHPAIGYWDETDDRVLFIRASTSTGTSASDWGTPVEVADNEGVMNAHMACAIVDGKPVMAWTRNQELRCGVAYDAQGTSWFKFDVDVGDVPYDVGEDISICDINGKPAISHYDNGNNDARVSVGIVP